MFGFQPKRVPTFNSVTEVRGRKTARSGQVLIEFAFVSLAFYFLLAGTIEMGRALHGSQALQNAARVCARELSVMPMPATITFREAVGLDPTIAGSRERAAADRVRDEVFDSGRLVLNVDGVYGVDYDNLLASLPLVNQMLVPLMIRERIAIGGGAETDVLRYPGAIYANPNFDAAMPKPGELGYLVRIPRIISRGSDGAETIEMVDVLTEIGEGTGEGPFSILSPGTHKGLVAIRMYYPFQAATLSAYGANADGSNRVFEAGSAGLASGATPVDFTSTTVGTYSGRYGLGSQEALTKKVRPFRRLLSAQSIFRREVFQ